MFWLKLHKSDTWYFYCFVWNKKVLGYGQGCTCFYTALTVFWNQAKVSRSCLEAVPTQVRTSVPGESHPSERKVQEITDFKRILYGLLTDFVRLIERF